MSEATRAEGTMAAVEQAVGAPLDPDSITGNFEVCEASGLVAGWAASNASATPLEVDLLADGQLFTRIVADEFRADLLQAGIGEGRHGFRLMLPIHLFDGSEHVIDVREMWSGRALAGSPRTFQATRAPASDIALDVSALAGWARTETPISRLALMEGGHVIARGEAVQDASDLNLARFRIPLPDPVLDGRPHHFFLWDTEAKVAVGQLAVTTPFMLTPQSLIGRYGGDRVKPYLGAAAGFRYESLVRSLEQVAADVEPEGGGGGRLSRLLRTHARLARGLDKEAAGFEPLEFATDGKPRMSIVIPVYNQFPVTYYCLCSLLLAHCRASFEVILVDDASTDQTRSLPELAKGVHYLRNEENAGFIQSCNRGALLARGEYVVILNNDTEVTSGWLDELLWAFEHFDRVGLAGAKLLYPDGSLQEAGGIVWNSGDPWNYGRHGNPHEPRYSYTRQADYVSGACIMLPRALWMELGGFDPAYSPAYFEDVDLAFRVREKGYRTVYVPLCRVIHFEGASGGTSTGSGTKRFQEVNRPLFKRRWAAACARNGTVGSDPDFNKDRGVGFRALVLDAEVPMPDHNAGGHAALQEMRLLQALGFKCTFLPQDLTWMGRHSEALQRMGVECVHAPFASSVREVLERRGAEFDLVYIIRYQVAQAHLEWIRRHAPQAKVVLNDCDLHFLREMRAAAYAKDSGQGARALATREAELRVMREVDLVLTYTDIEKAVIFSHNGDESRVARCPWVTGTASTVPGLEARSGIAFLGGFRHPPNTEAVQWFAAEVMPLLRQALPGVRFHVYGSQVPRAVSELAGAHADIVIEGWVPDVATVYNTCRVFVAPMLSGAGLKGKVIDALAHGVPSVISPISAEGIPLGEGVHAHVAGRPEEWVAAIARLCQDPQAWTEMSRQALGFAQSHYGYAQGVAQMQQALQQVGLYMTPANSALAAR